MSFVTDGVVLAVNPKAVHVRFLTLSDLISALVVLMATLTLIGGAFDIEMLTAGLPDHRPTSYGSALGLIALSISLALTKRRSSHAQQLAKVLSGGVLLFAGSILWGHITGQNLWSLSVRHMPGFSSGLILSLCSLALLRLGPRTESDANSDLAETATVMAGIIAFIVLNGYAFGSAALTSFPNLGRFDPISIPFTIAALGLSTAILTARPRKGITRILSNSGMGGLIARRLFLVMSFGPVTLYLLSETGSLLRLYDRASVPAIFTVASAIITFILISWVTRILNRIEEERIHQLEREHMLRTRAESAARTRDEIVAMVSHDLRNPLSSILLTGDILLTRADPNPRCAQLTHSIIRSARRLNRMIEDLLDAHRMDQGVFSIKDSTCIDDIRAVIEESILQQGTLAEQRRIQLRSEMPKHLPSVFVNRDRISQVLQNLIGNAIKFTESGGTVKVAAEVKEGFLHCSVSDNGPGIAPGILPHVFNRFTQDHRTASLGTGLGLAIAKGIIEGHHGRIWVDSLWGVGSTFHFTLPLISPLPVAPFSQVNTGTMAEISPISELA